MIRPRIIPVLLIEDKKLVKTVKFKNSNYLGDPINATKIFNEKEVDELCILDISATKRSEPDFKLLQDIAEEAFIPLSYGGGVKSVEVALKILKMGYEKIVLNTSAVEDFCFVKDLVHQVGSQSVVVSVDYRKNRLFGERCYIKNGTKRVAYSPIELAKKMEDLGVGEILLQCIDNDGKMTGLDFKTIQEVSVAVNIPVIACGGVKDLKDIKIALNDTNASAVAAGSIFVYYGSNKAVLINYPEEKKLIEEGILKYE